MAPRKHGYREGSINNNRALTHRSFNKAIRLRSWLPIVCFCCFLFTQLPHCNASFIVTIPPKDEECFFVKAPKSTGTLLGNFQQVDSDELSSKYMTVIIMNSATSRILYRSRRGNDQGTFRVQLEESQKVTICIQNGSMTNSNKKKKAVIQANKPHDGKERTVGIDFRIDTRNVAEELKSTSGKLQTSAIELARSMSNMLNHHDYMRTREAKHREVTETTFSKLLNWALLEGLIVVLVAGAQIVYLRRFIEVRRYI